MRRSSSRSANSRHSSTLRHLGGGVVEDEIEDDDVVVAVVIPPPPSSSIDVGGLLLGGGGLPLTSAFDGRGETSMIGEKSANAVLATVVPIDARKSMRPTTMSLSVSS